MMNTENDDDNGVYLAEGNSCNIVGGLIHKCVAFVVGSDVLLLEEKWTSIKDIFKHSGASASLRVMAMRIIGMLTHVVCNISDFRPYSHNFILHTPNRWTCSWIFQLSHRYSGSSFSV